MAVRYANIWSKLVVVVVVIAYLWFCSNGLVRNLHLGAGIGFDVGGLEMVGFVWESGCCSAGDAGDGLVMVGFMWESSWCCVGDGLVITVCESGDGLVIIGFSGHMCWQLQQ